MDNLIGRKFGKWTVIERDFSKHKTRNMRWNCVCDCGTKRSVLGKYLLNGGSTSCGCNRKVDLTGERFGKLTVIETIYGYNGYNRASYKCKCDCGNIMYVKGASIYKITSCGCSRLANDISGQKFGKLTVIRMLYRYKNNNTYCECKCDCGNTVIAQCTNIKNGNTKSCGCIHAPSLIGKKFGKLTVINEIPSETNQRIWMCKCDCGAIVNIHSHQLNSGHTSSCGCIRSEKNSKNEVFIAKILKQYGIDYEIEKAFHECIGVGNRRLRFDFYLPEYNTLIEYDGLQHFKPIEFFGGDKKFEVQQKNDKIKNKFCKDHNINLKRIPYSFSLERIENEIMNIIKNPVTTTA